MTCFIMEVSRQRAVRMTTTPAHNFSLHQRFPRSHALPQRPQIQPPLQCYKWGLRGCPIISTVRVLLSEKHYSIVLCRELSQIQCDKFLWPSCNYFIHAMLDCLQYKIVRDALKVCETRADLAVIDISRGAGLQCSAPITQPTTSLYE